MPSFKATTLALLASMPLALTYTIEAYSQNFCSMETKGDTMFTISGPDHESNGDIVCHSFGNPPEGSGCTYGTSDGNGGVSSTACTPGEISVMYSAAYLDGMDNELTGCYFWSNDDCSGSSQHFAGPDETNNCFEFDMSVQSFYCL